MSKNSNEIDDLIGKMIRNSQVISEDKSTGDGIYIFLNEDRVYDMAAELRVSFDEMVLLLKQYFNK